MGLVVAWCRLPPPSSSPWSFTADATPPTTTSLPPHLVLLHPLRPPPPPLLSRPLRPLDRRWRRHGPACGVDALPPGPTRQVPLPHAPPSSGYGPIAPALSSRPQQCLGLLSGGRRYTLLRFSGPRHRSGDGNGSTATLMLVPGNPAP
jgi:hypothetical protein